MSQEPERPERLPAKVAPPALTPTSTPERVVLASELFGERSEIEIELHGVRYRLRITRRGRLILQK